MKMQRGNHRTKEQTEEATQASRTAAIENFISFKTAT